MISLLGRVAEMKMNRSGYFSLSESKDTFDDKQNSLKLELVLKGANVSWNIGKLEISFNSVHKTKLVILDFCLSLTKRIEKIGSLIAKLSGANNLDDF